MKLRLLIIALLLTATCFAQNNDEVVVARRRVVNATPSATLLGSNGCSGTSCSVTGLSLTAGQNIIVLSIAADTSSTSSVTDNGSGGANTYTVRDSCWNSNGFYHTSISDSINIVHTATSVTVNFAASSSDSAVYVVNATNIASFDKLLTCGTGSGTTPTTGSVTPTQSSNALGIAVMRINLACSPYTPSYSNDLVNAGANDVSWQLVGGGATAASGTCSGSQQWTTVGGVYNHS